MTADCSEHLIFCLGLEEYRFVRRLSPGAMRTVRIVLVSLLLAIANGQITKAEARFGDGGPAIRARLSFPTAVVTAPDGGIFIADTGHGRIRRVGQDGIISTIAGGGFAERPRARLSRPTGIAFAPDGALVIADPRANRVWALRAGSRLEPLAGTGRRGYSGDGGSAKRARLNRPFAVAVEDDGAVLIADRGNDRVRRVNEFGTITTLIGGPPPPHRDLPGPIPDFRPIEWSDRGRSTSLSSPSGLAVTADGGVLVADTGNNVIRRLAYGITTVVAGNGTPGFSGDGEFALGAELAAPVGIVPTADGGFLFAERDHQRVREVSPSGVLRTVAGDGNVGRAPPHAPAERSPLAWPAGVAALGSGGALIADTNAHAILRVDADGGLTKIAGAERAVARRNDLAPLATLSSYLTHEPLSVHRGCRLRLRYATSRDATGLLARRKGLIWHGRITYWYGSRWTAPIHFKPGTYNVWFWARDAGETAPLSQTTLTVRQAKC